MATYAQKQQWIKVEFGFSAKSCWIAHVKEICGLPVRRAYNRIGDERKNPCPPGKIDKIRECFRHFGMIK
ncbi:MAG: hypothetical protein GYA34_02090 [Chloroflexi bacterium]|nr:hypothetical protein [Chloroflexota bacterium]